MEVQRVRKKSPDDVTVARAYRPLVVATSRKLWINYLTNVTYSYNKNTASWEGCCQIKIYSQRVRNNLRTIINKLILKTLISDHLIANVVCICCMFSNRSNVVRKVTAGWKRP